MSVELRVRPCASADSLVLSHSNESGTKKFASPVSVRVSVSVSVSVRFRVRVRV